MENDDRDEPFPNKNERRDGETSGPFIGEAIKKIFTAGVSAAFMTEESVRSFVSELKLPKESLNLLLQGASKSKEELMNRVGRELIGMVKKIDLVKEASRFMEEHKFKISAEIEILRKEPEKGLAKNESHRSSSRESGSNRTDPRHESSENERSHEE